MLRVIQSCCFNWGFLRALFPPWIWMPLTSRLSFFLLVLVVLLSGWIWKALVVPSIFGMYLDTSSSKLVIQSSFYCPIYLSDRREIGHTVTAPGKTQVDGAVSSSGGITSVHLCFLICKPGDAEDHSSPSRCVLLSLVTHSGIYPHPLSFTLPPLASRSVVSCFLSFLSDL